MPTPKQIANLKPGKGRPPRDTSQLNVTLPNPLLTIVDRIATQQGWSKSYAIEVYLKKALNQSEFNGYSADDLDLIAKGAPIE